MTDVFRLGLVGGGRMGQTHLRALESSTSVEVVAIAEPHAATADRLRGARQKVHPTVAAMVDEGGIDGALVAATTAQHLVLVEQLTSARLPVLCEKPCGLSSDQARAAGDIATRNGVLLQVGYWRRFVPELQDLRRRIRGGELGALHLSVCAQWDESPPPAAFRASSGGIFVDMGVHEIDQILWMTGQEITAVSATAFPVREDEGAAGDVDSAQALLSLSGGGTAIISLGRHYPDGDMVFAEIYGSRDHVRVETLLPSSGQLPQLEALRLQAEAFARDARSGAIPEGATAEDAVTALTIAKRLSNAAGLAVLGQADR